jgi:hypothetical protein
MYGIICEDFKDDAKAANFSMLAAKCKPSSSKTKNWMKIGYLLKSVENYEIAALYFGKALKSAHKNT